MRKYLSLCLCIVLIFTSVCVVNAEPIKYLPDVTKEMSNPDFWDADDSVLMTLDEIKLQNERTISASGTCMYDLKNMPEVVNTVELNKALLTSTQADVNYYLGWTYLESTKLAKATDFKKFISNTQKRNPKKKDKVLYAVAVKRTHLHTFPSHTAIWDDPADPECNYQYLTGVNVNEPLVITSVSKDKKFYLAKSICCSGWVPAEDVAICKDKAEWLSAWDLPSEKSLVVYDDKVYTQMSVTGKETSELMLTLGTVLELEEDIDPNNLTDNRSAYQNYAVYIPVRNTNGSYSKKLTLISESEKVSAGYLPMTERNIVEVVMGGLGNTYGWGDWLNSNDCSGYIRNVYKCFGMELARNTTWQEKMPMAKVDMKNMCREERVRILKAMPAGTILYFNGHEMMYLGSVDDKLYVISATGSMMQPGNASVRQRIRSIIINTLDVKRANGNTWLDELTCAIVPWQTPENNTLPEYSWYHDGVTYCLKNGLMKLDANKMFNPDNKLTWADILQILSSAEGASYQNALEWARENDLYKEFTNLNPDDFVTREYLVYALYRYMQYKGIDVNSDNGGQLTYSDASEVSDFAVEAMKVMTSANIISGKGNNTIKPNSYITRAETAVIIERFMKFTDSESK